MTVQFYKDKTNGNIKIINSNTEQDLNGFTKLTPNITDKGGEKHLPIFTITDNKIEIAVGEILHPMDDNHFINFIYLETNKGEYLKNFTPADKPTATFVLNPNETPTSIYEYCNLHGLWKTEVKG